MYRLLQSVAVLIAGFSLLSAIIGVVAATEVKNEILLGIQVLFAIGAAGYTFVDVREVRESLATPLLAIAIGFLSLCVGYATDQGIYNYGIIFNNTVENASDNETQFDSTLKAIGDK